MKIRLLLFLLAGLIAKADVMDRLVVKTNGVINNLQLNGTTIYGGSGSNDLTANTLFNLGLRGANGETVSVYPTAHTTKNIASLMGLNTGLVTTNATVEVRGYYEPGDGGGGTFYYAPAEATNRGTVFQAGSASFVWKRLIDGQPITPKMFGAKGDQSTDDATAIQAAVDYVGALTNSSGIKVGGTVYFPPGVYYIRTAISMKPRVNLQGPGKNRSENYQQTGSITGLGSGGAATLMPDPNYSTAIETLVFDGTTSAELPVKGTGSSFLNGEDGEMYQFYSTVEGMNIYGTLATGGGRKSAIRIWRAMYVTIRNCSVMQARGNLIYAYGCLGLRLQDNTLINYHGRNTFIFALSDGFLINNQFEAGLGYNLWAQMNHNAVVGNSFPNPAEDIYVGSLDGAATNAFTSFTADASTDLITATLNGAPLTTMTVGDPVFFHANSGTLPGGLSKNVAYFVSTVDTTAGTFSVSSRITETSGGTAGAWEGNKLDITSTGSGNWSVSQAAESNVLLYNCNGNSITGGRVDFSLRDGIRVIAGNYPTIEGVEYYNIGRMQGIRAIATRTNTIAALHVMTTSSEGKYTGTINMSATNGVGRIGVWLDGTGLYRNNLSHTYNNCATNVWNTSTATANTVDLLDQGGGTILWQAPATVSGAWTFNNPPLFQNATAGSVGAVVKGQEATSVLDIYGAGTTAGLGPRVNFLRSRGTLGSPSQVQAGDAVIPLIAQAYDNGGTYRSVAEIQANAENNITSSAFGGSVVLRAVPIGASTSRQNFFYGLARGVAISDSTAGYPDNTTVLDLVSTTRGLGLPSMTADVSSPRDGVLWYRSDTDVLKLRANGATVDLLGYTGTPSTGQIIVYTNSAWTAMTPNAGTLTAPSAEFVDHFIQRQDGGTKYYGDIWPGGGGSGGGVNYQALVDTGGHPGVAALNTGSTSSANAYLTTANDGLLLGYGATEFECAFQFSALSDATDTFTFHAGFFDGFGSTAVVDGAFVRYSHGVNSGKFQFVTSSNSTQSTGDTAVTVSASTWYRIKVVVNAAGTSATATVMNGSGTVLGTSTITSNIPTGSGRQCGTGTQVVRTAGTATRNTYVDWHRLKLEPTP